MTAETIPAEVLAKIDAFEKEYAGAIHIGGAHLNRHLWPLLQDVRAILADRSTRPAEPAPEVEVVAWGAETDGFWELCNDEETARRRHEPKRKVEALVRLSTLEAERARAGAAEADAREILSRFMQACNETAEETERTNATKADADDLRRERDNWRTSFEAMNAKAIANARERNSAQRLAVTYREARERYRAERDAEHKARLAAETALSRALQAQNEALRAARNESARLARDFGFNHALKILEDALGSPTYYAADGSETWEGDTRGTIYNLLRTAGVWRGDDDTLVTKEVDEAWAVIGDRHDLSLAEEIAALMRRNADKATALQAQEQIARAAFIAGRDSIYGVDPAYHEAAWEAYRARLRADQPTAGEQADG